MVTEDDCEEAVRQILAQLYRLTDVGLPGRQIGRIEREAIFYLYEGLDKYGEAKPHSAAARVLRKQHNGKFPPKSVIYDHAIPLASLRNELRSAVLSQAAMSECLRKFIRGVVVTREEDGRLNAAGLRRKLPPVAQPHDMLARYKAVGISFETADEAMLKGYP